MHLTTFFTKLVHKVDSKAISCDEKLTLVAKPNKYDSRSVEVHNSQDDIIGYIPHVDADMVFDFLKEADVTASVRVWNGENGNVPGQLRVDLNIPAELDLTCNQFYTPPLPGSKWKPNYAAAFEAAICGVYSSKIDPKLTEVWCKAMSQILDNVELSCSSRLLFRFMLDYPKELAYSCDEEIRRENALRQRRQRYYEAFACEAGTEFLHYGSLRLLPLKALKGAEVRTVPEALLRGELAFPTAHSGGRHANGFIVDTKLPILGVHGAAFRTTKGTYTIFHEGYIPPADDDDFQASSTFKGAFNHSEEPKVFVCDARPTIPEIPELPEDATGFAVFWGDELISIRLFGSHTPAVEALGFLPGFDWHIGHGCVTLTPKEASKEVCRVLGGIYPFGDQLHEAYFGHQPGLFSSENHCRIDDAGRLMNLYLRIKGFDFKPCDPTITYPEYLD